MKSWSRRNGIMAQRVCIMLNWWTGIGRIDPMIAVYRKSNIMILRNNCQQLAKRSHSRYAPCQMAGRIPKPGPLFISRGYSLSQTKSSTHIVRTNHATIFFCALITIAVFVRKLHFSIIFQLRLNLCLSCYKLPNQWEAAWAILIAFAVPGIKN